MPAKKETHRENISSLKKQLAELQDKLYELEGAEPLDEEGIQVLFNWASPERVFVPRNLKWFGNVGLIVLVLLLIALFLQEFLLMGAILAVVFVVYVLATIPPQRIEHRITTQGVISNEHSFLWDELADFWFTEKQNQHLLIIRTFLRFPYQLSLVIHKDDEATLRNLLVKYIPFREAIHKSWVDRAEEWVTKKLSSI
jgi:hypothetical protein